MLGREPDATFKLLPQEFPGAVDRAELAVGDRAGRRRAQRATRSRSRSVSELDLTGKGKTPWKIVAQYEDARRRRVSARRPPVDLDVQGRAEPQVDLGAARRARCSRRRAIELAEDPQANLAELERRARRHLPRPRSRWARAAVAHAVGRQASEARAAGRGLGRAASIIRHEARRRDVRLQHVAEAGRVLRLRSEDQAGRRRPGSHRRASSSTTRSWRPRSRSRARTARRSRYRSCTTRTSRSTARTRR